MRTTQILLFSMLTYFTAIGAASDIYLFLDTNCMDRYQYQTVVKNGQSISQSDYFTYHIKINNSERVVLNTAGTNRTVSMLPAGVKYCGDMPISESFARQINNKQNKIFLVTQARSGYSVVDIHSADYFFTTDSEMGYSTNEFSFAYNYSTKNKSNLASKDSQGKVYYQNRDDNYCPSKYKFRRTPKKNHDPYNDITLVPDIGITEKKTGLDAANANNNILSLKAVNGIPLVKYMDAVCNGYVDYLKKDMAASANTTTSGSTATTTTTGTYTDTKTATGNYTAGTGTTTHTGTYNGTSTSQPTYTSSGTCSHIYKDLERGFYYNRNTGEKVNESCGGVNYVKGLVPGEYISVDNRTTTPVTTTTTSYPSTSSYPTTSTTVYTEPTRTTSTTRGTTQSDCSHIYKDLDKGFYYNKNTGQKANEECGGIVYQGGLMTNTIATASSSSVVSASPPATVQSENSYPTTTSSYPSTTSYPTSSPVYTPAPAPVYSGSTANLVHIVAPKETLYSISKRYGVSLTELKSWNSLTKTDLISPGMTLKLSQPSEVYSARSTAPNLASSHTVKKRETLYSIAKKYGLTINELKSYNGLTSNTLNVGQVLMLNGSTSSVAPSSYQAVSPVTTTTVAKTYIPSSYNTTSVSTTPVKTESFSSKGSSVTSYSAPSTTNSSYLQPTSPYASKDGLTDKAVADHLNNYGNGRLVHMVDKSETLFSISRKYGIPVAELRRINNLDKNEIIIPNQKLFVTE